MYIKQLDGLRCLAVSLVIFAHWGNRESLWVSALPYGFFGVNLFFVISGFLITRILLENDVQNEGSKLPVVKNFFIRRSLRIFPLYYFTLLFFIVFNQEHIRDHLFQYVFYYCNWTYFINNAMDGLLSPRWSLAVEEQFYLVWPWVILFLNKKYVGKFLVSIIILSILARLVITLAYPDRSFAQFLTVSNFDSLGFGGLIAYALMFPDRMGFYFLKYTRVITISGLVAIMMFAFLRLRFGMAGILYSNLNAIATTIFSVGMVGMVTTERMWGFLGRCFQNTTVVYLGRISYGLYLYHSLVFPILYILHIRADVLYSREITGVVCLLLIASASWFFFEKPINNLKRYFEY